MRLAARHPPIHVTPGGKPMGLRLKFNLVLLLVFVLGLGVSGYVSHQLLQKNAREEVLRTAGVMMEAAMAMRSYTVAQIRPHLRVVENEFLPHSVPAYAATEIMGQLHAQYPNYAYKEAALNPTNPRDRAVGWEADIINEFRNNADRKEFSGIRLTPTGLSMYLARPFQIKDPNCLACHTTAESAPPAMVKLYGSNNGFGWKLNEVIGAQIVSVPMSLPIEKADSTFLTFMASLAGVFAVLFVILNLMLSVLIVRPIRRMSAAADKISVGELDVPELNESGKDEVAVLGKSFNRMRRSLEKAISLIDDN
jgi:HAMP domain-containing protein